jgi:hypothetical protein
MTYGDRRLRVRPFAARPARGSRGRSATRARERKIDSGWILRRRTRRLPGFNFNCASAIEVDPPRKFHSHGAPDARGTRVALLDRLSHWGRGLANAFKAGPWQRFWFVLESS